MTSGKYHASTPFLHDGSSHFVTPCIRQSCLFRSRGAGYSVYLGDDFWKILRIQLDAWFAAYTCAASIYGGFEEVHTHSTLSGCASWCADTASWADLRFLFVVARVFIAVCDGRRLHRPFLPGIWQSLVRCLPRSWKTGKLERRGDGSRFSAWFNSGYAHASVYGEFGWM